MIKEVALMKNKMSQNPYMLIFGKEPDQLISRSAQSSEVIENFNAEKSGQPVYMITGLRGCGKTVFMTEVASALGKDDKWIVIELSSATDLLRDLAEQLASENKLALMFQKASINLSFWGIGLEVSGSVPITNIQVALTKMLESLKKHKKRVLICIDEVVNNVHMREFSSVFQILLRKDLPVFLLMTGLYENINSLRNEKNLTFLYRAPRIELKPLNLGTISENYRSVFGLDVNDALQMAKLTLGYSFAFQVMGYYTWVENGDYKKAIPDVKRHLEDYVYEKVWSELSQRDRLIVYGIAKSETGKAEEIKMITGIKHNEYSPYRDRLLKRGIIRDEGYGYISLVLPFFGEYAVRMYEYL